MKRRAQLTMDLTPLIDVVFILLIFFMVSSVFKNEELAILLDLPDSEQSVSTKNDNSLLIELSNNKLAFKGKILDFTSLENRLKVINDIKTLVVVRIDKTVEYQRITQLFDILKKYQLTNLSLQSQRK